eukprot:scaffold149725_cov18-Prasinocladus_malaysianus.AAC.1
MFADFLVPGADPKYEPYALSPTPAWPGGSRQQSTKRQGSFESKQFGLFHFFRAECFSYLLTEPTTLHLATGIVGGHA